MDRADTVILEKGSLFAGRYAIERVIGSGGMGVVYQVLDRQTARRRALKVLSIGGAAWRGTDLPREVMVGAGIDTPHVVDIIDAGIDGYTGYPFLAMEFLRGEDLARRRARLGRCPADEVAIHLHQVGRALHAIHRAGVIHRDLKPANIFLCQTAGVQIIKVLDFGIAKLMDGADILTAGPRAGTPSYMAPEQLRGDPVTPATDVYAFAMVAFELLVGRRYSIADAAPPGDSAPGSGGRLTVGEQLAAWGIDLDLPPAFDDWFARASSLRPADRFPDALLAADALAGALAVEVSASPYLPVPPADQLLGRAHESMDVAEADEVPSPSRRSDHSNLDDDQIPTGLLLPKTVLSRRAADRLTEPGVATPRSQPGQTPAVTRLPIRARRIFGALAVVAALATTVTLVFALRFRGPAVRPAPGNPVGGTEIGTVAPPQPPRVITAAAAPGTNGEGKASGKPPSTPRRTRPAPMGVRRPANGKAAAGNEDDFLYTRR